MRSPFESFAKRLASLSSQQANAAYKCCRWSSSSLLCMKNSSIHKGKPSKQGREDLIYYSLESGRGCFTVQCPPQAFGIELASNQYASSLHMYNLPVRIIHARVLLGDSISSHRNQNLNSLLVLLSYAPPELTDEESAFSKAADSDSLRMSCE